MILQDNAQGNYQFLTGIAPYSCGVRAMPGFEIIRVEMSIPTVLDEQAFDRISEYLINHDRTIHALCAMELRIPKPLSFDGFAAFNKGYQDMLAERGLLLGDVNPIARTNISPSEYQIAQPSIYAFSYTIPVKDDSLGPTFIVAGAGDLADQTDLSVSAIVRPGETSAEARREKIKVVMDVMADRLTGLKTGWENVTSTSIYTTIPMGPLIVDSVLGPSGSPALKGVVWYYSNPPIQGLDYEMDVRGVRKELVIDL